MLTFVVSYDAIAAQREIELWRIAKQQQYANDEPVQQLRIEHHSIWPNQITHRLELWRHGLEPRATKSSATVAFSTQIRS